MKITRITLIHPEDETVRGYVAAGEYDADNIVVTVCVLDNGAYTWLKMSKHKDDLPTPEHVNAFIEKAVKSAIERAQNKAK